MEAVRLKLPLETLRLIREYSSDRIGVHPTAEVWGKEVDRLTWTDDDGDATVEWQYEVEEGGMRFMCWVIDANGCRPFSQH